MPALTTNSGKKTKSNYYRKMRDITKFWAMYNIYANHVNDDNWSL